MPTLRESLIAAGGPHEEAAAASAGEAGQRIAALEREVQKLRRDLSMARYVGLIALAVSVGLVLRSILQP
jgi:hypothetical protein